MDKTVEMTEVNERMDYDYVDSSRDGSNANLIWGRLWKELKWYEKIEAWVTIDLIDRFWDKVWDLQTWIYNKVFGDEEREIRFEKDDELLWRYVYVKKNRWSAWKIERSAYREDNGAWVEIIDDDLLGE